MKSLLLLLLASCSVPSRSFCVSGPRVNINRQIEVTLNFFRDEWEDAPCRTQGFVLKPMLFVKSFPCIKRLDALYNSDPYIDEHDDVIHDQEDDSLDELQEASAFDYTSFKKRIQANLSDDMYETEESSTLPKGKLDGFVIIQQYHVSLDGFHNFSLTCPDITPDEVQRLKLEPNNVTLPVALMMLDPLKYPSFSRARKACREGSILIHRGPLGWNEEEQSHAIFDADKCIRGRVGHRILSGDVIGKQIRMAGGFYPSVECAEPPFGLPVIYEDDHFAIVNKPAGVLVYAHRRGGHGQLTIRSALPYVLKPPRRGTMSIMRRPTTVHRLDKPTSGLLIVAKTKPAMVDLFRQFVERRVKKTYIAVVNGIPDKLMAPRISSLEAHNLGFDVTSHDNDVWNLIDHPIDEKSATTLWRSIKYARSLVAKDDTITMVELKPKTGRFHQLRRHMAWICETPIIGDSEYDENTPSLLERGLFLCANKISLEHPYFNTIIGRKEWNDQDSDEKYAGGKIHIADNGSVQVGVAIDLPRKFSTFFTKEGEREKR